MCVCVGGSVRVWRGECVCVEGGVCVCGGGECTCGGGGVYVRVEGVL